MLRVGGGRSKKVFFRITFVEQQIGISEYFPVGFRSMGSFDLSNSLIAQLYQKLVWREEGEGGIMPTAFSS